ncbi:MAG: acyl-CoA dehydrogenase family protein, partial [Candidatus Geothermincolia bacterium]
MLDFSFEEEDLQFLGVVREFAQNEIKPAGKELDRQFDPEIFWKVWRKAAGIGLLGVMVPEAFGGVGGSVTSLLLLVEELAAADAGITGSMALNWAVQSILILVANSRQMEKFLPMISGTDALPAGGCITEPQGGSDVESVSRCGPGAMTTTYKKTADGYVINGTKCFITNGTVAGLYVVIASSDPGAGASATSAFIVPADTPGVCPGGLEDKMGFRASPTAPVSFDDVLVPHENLLGDEGMGMDYVELAMMFNRWAVGLLAVGVAR